MACTSKHAKPETVRTCFVRKGQRLALLAGSLLPITLLSTMVSLKQVETKLCSRHTLFGQEMNRWRTKAGPPGLSTPIQQVDLTFLHHKQFATL